jgi:hypothetical protein
VGRWEEEEEEMTVNEKRPCGLQWDRLARSDCGRSINHGAANQGVFDVCYAPNSGTKADVARGPGRATKRHSYDMKEAAN